jgi:hypothetical protein
VLAAIADAGACALTGVYGPDRPLDLAIAFLLAFARAVVADVARAALRWAVGHNERLMRG